MNGKRRPSRIGQSAMTNSFQYFIRSIAYGRCSHSLCSGSIVFGTSVGKFMMKRIQSGTIALGLRSDSILGILSTNTWSSISFERNLLKKIYIIKSTPWLKDLSFKIKPIFFKKEIQKEFMKNIVLFYIFKKNHKIYTSNNTVIETLSEYLNERGKSCNASPSGTDREAFTPKFSAPIPAEALRQCNIIRSSVSKGYRFTKRHPILLLPRN